MSIIYPFNKALFPPEFPSPAFSWVCKSDFHGSWKIKIFSENRSFLIDTVIENQSWMPTRSQWEELKQLSANGKIRFSVSREGKLGKTGISFRFSTDSVAAPILYRQMPIPFVVAEKELDSMNYMLIDIGSPETPHIAMRGFSVCGNCHSFSKNGSHISLDLDAGRRDKGGYFVARLADTVAFNIHNYMSWTKIEKRRTFGLFSKLSPDGRYIVTTVKDRIMNKNFPDDPGTNAFSQVFIPVNGHLAVYDRETRQLKELPGADLDEYVQTNAIWTPDGKNIIYCRAKAIPYRYDTSGIEIRDRKSPEEIFDINISEEEFIDKFNKRNKSFKYDICIIPFNEGKGGVAKPVTGASDNGVSNYFPAISPDGKLIVFCQAENFMLLQSDSRLHIVSIDGKKSEKLSCNLPLMNSWHAWSPNSKWLVFVSKGLSIYTDMFLTHIDGNGNATPPILLEKARQYHRVANYPEFLNVRPGFVFSMKYDYVEMAHIERALDKGDINEAINLYYRFKDQGPILFKDDYFILYQFLKKMQLKNEMDSVQKKILTSDLN